MSQDPKHPKPAPPVPSFDDLGAARRPATSAPARNPFADDEKTSQIDAELLKKMRRQSQQPAPDVPPARPEALTVGPQSRPGPGHAPISPAPSEPKPVPAVRGLAAPPSTRVTERREPVTPDAIHPQRAAAPRAVAPVHTAAPATAKPDPSSESTVISTEHRRTAMLQAPPPSAGATRPKAPEVTQPAAVNPFLPDGAAEAKPAVPWLEVDQATRSDRPTATVEDLEAELISQALEPSSGLAEVTQPAAAGLPRGVSPDRRPGRPEQPRAAEAGRREQPPNRPEQPRVAETSREGEASRSEPSRAAGAEVEVVAAPASVVRRVGALLIDTLCLGGLVALLGTAVLAVGRPAALPDGTGLLDAVALRVNDSPRLLIAMLVLALAVAVAYTTFFAVAASGRTPGRLVFGVHLVDARGGRPSMPRALIRALFAVVSFAFAGAGFWWWLFDDESQTLHDRICSTFVVRLKTGRS